MNYFIFGNAWTKINERIKHVIIDSKSSLIIFGLKIAEE